MVSPHTLVYISSFLVKSWLDILGTKKYPWPDCSSYPLNNVHARKRADRSGVGAMYGAISVRRQTIRDHRSFRAIVLRRSSCRTMMFVSGWVTARDSTVLVYALLPDGAMGDVGSERNMLCIYIYLQCLARDMDDEKTQKLIAPSVVNIYIYHTMTHTQISALHADTYTTHAHKFSSTRHKIRPERDHIYTAVSTWKATHSTITPRIIELGCGDGRLVWLIEQIFGLEWYIYTWVDVSSWLLDIARTSYPHHTWICDDMIHRLSIQPDQSADMIFSIASIQHIIDPQMRSQYATDAYRVCLSWGLCLSLNRSWSWRFVRRYWKSIVRSIYIYISNPSQSSLYQGRWSDGHRGRQDISIMFTSQGTTSERIYHMFFCHHVHILHTKAWFVTSSCHYVTREGHVTQRPFYARNSLYIWHKV
jgi:ubiquinone/menaquinone biosynthesis C-methylase UbiE